MTLFYGSGCVVIKSVEFKVGLTEVRESRQLKLSNNVSELHDSYSMFSGVYGPRCE